MNKGNTNNYQHISDVLGSIYFISLIVGGILFCVAFIVAILNLSSALPVVIALLAICAVICITTYLLSKSYKRKAMVASGKFESIAEAKKYEEQQTAIENEAYNKRMEQKRAEQIKRDQEIKAAQHPQCPACRGNNTRRISTAKRVASTAVVGIASSTIGKQYECLDCSHKW